MSKGLEITEVNVKDIDFSDRIDAEYFSRVDLQIQSKLRQKGASELRDFCDFVASAFYPAATQLYEIGDTPFVRCVDCISHPIITHDQDDAFEKIPRAFVEENKGVSFLGRNDIVLTKVGTPCFASLIGEHEYVALSRTVMGLQSVHDIDPRYLMVFLRSRYGFAQLMRQRELTIQYQLTLERVKRILVYRPDAKVEKAICSLVDRYQEIVSQSRRTYQEAEDLLCNELGFANWNPTCGGVSTKPFSEVASVGRIDAEYFQPKFDELMRRLAKCKLHELGGQDGLADLYKSIDPPSDLYGDEGVPFVRISDFSKFGVESTGVRLPEDVCKDCRRIRKDTILLTKDGSVGIAYKAEDDFDAVTSGAILHLTLKDGVVDPDYLTLVLNSRIVQMQAERDAGGSIIQHWKPSQVEKVKIPVLPRRIQLLLANKVRESFRLRNESKLLLDLAKFAVELAIEKGDDTALSYMMHKGT